MISVLIGLGILSLAIIPLETVFPGIAGQRRLRRGWLLDLIHWFFTALITRPIARAAVIVTLAPLLWLTGSGSFESLLRGRGPLGRQPPFAQAVQMLIVIDFIGYWLHRFFHSAKLWSFHAIHHSSAELECFPRRACIRSTTLSIKASRRWLWSRSAMRRHCSPGRCRSLPRRRFFCTRT